MVLGSFQFPSETSVGNLLLLMSVSSYSLIQNPRFWQGNCVCMWVICCWVAVSQHIVGKCSTFTFFRVAKWKRNQGEFCGSLISQDVLTKEITVSQSTYALEINKSEGSSTSPARRQGNDSRNQESSGVQWCSPVGGEGGVGRILPCR